MNQQNQLFSISQGCIIPAPTHNLKNRQFKLLKQIGSGSEGYIYKANPIDWPGFQQEVALKFQWHYKDDIIDFYKKIRDYQNQYENPNSSNYYPSNVIRIYDYFEYQYMLVTVMELGSIDLFNYLKQNTLTIQQKQSIMIQILSSIAFLHSQNTFHRDIKPENYIMVGQQVKLTDFGLIKMQNNNQRPYTLQVGSKLFQAPELIEGKNDYTMAVDVWAMAFVFYEIIEDQQTLIQVQTEDELNQKVKQHIQNQSYIYNKIDKLTISEEWKTIMKRMLHPNPNERITSKEASEILQKTNILPNVRSQNINIFPQSITIIPSQNANTNSIIPQNMNTIHSQNSNLIPPVTQPQIKQIPSLPLAQTQMQQQFQLPISNQINNLIQVLYQSTNLNLLQQQKEQSIKQLSNLKDITIKLLSQLDNNNVSKVPNEISEFNPDSQRQIQKKELPPDLKDEYEQIQKFIQEFQEKSMTIQEEQKFNQKKIELKNFIEKLKILIQKYDNKLPELQKLEDELKDLKQRQKLIIQKNLIQQELEDIKKSLIMDQSRQLQNQLQKDIEAYQKQISQYELQAKTVQYYQEQKKILDQKIYDLQLQISEGANAEKEMIQSKNELLALKMEQQIQEQLQEEIKKNEAIKDDLKNTIKKLEKNQQINENQQLEIAQFNAQIQDLKQIEDQVKQNKETITLMRAQLRELPPSKRYLETQQKDIEKLKNEIKPLGEIQKNIDTLSDQIKKLIEQKNLKLEKQEEEKTLSQLKEQLEKELAFNDKINQQQDTNLNERQNKKRIY